MGSRLFRFLLSLVIRLRRSVVSGRIALAIQARITSLWRSILTFARRQSQIRLHASDIPMVDNSMGERPEISELARVDPEEGGSGTLAAPPVWGVSHWQNELSRYQALTSSYQSNSDALPATPERGSQRYHRRTVISQSPDSLEIPAGQQTLLSASLQLPDGWRRHVHPEGNVFFYHEGLRIFTESNISHRETEIQILFYATTLIQKAIERGDIVLDELTEIVLNVDDNRRWYYYFVDHRNRLLFWVHPVKAREDLGTDLPGITGYNHLRYLVEAKYWYASSDGLSGMSAPYIVYDMESRSHCEYYPHNRTLPKGVFEELRGMLNHAKTDMMTTDSSTSLFTQEELVAILDLVNSLKDDKKISNPYSIWVIARLTAFFIENKFFKFYGQPNVQLNADVLLFGQLAWNRSARSILFRVINLFLYGSPNEYVLHLHRVCAGRNIILHRWKDAVNRFKEELGRCTILSTVMLAVNFSFLTFLSDGTSGSSANSSEIIVNCSIVSTIASIMFSFTLWNMYNDPGYVYSMSVADAMRMLSLKKWPMACLAIAHSLPIACLVWSITLFCTAPAVQIFGPKAPATITTLSVVCFIFVLFGLMQMYLMWLFSRNDDVYDVYTPAEDNPPPTTPKDDIELGSAGE